MNVKFKTGQRVRYVPLIDEEDHDYDMLQEGTLGTIEGEFLNKLYEGCVEGLFSSVVWDVSHDANVNNPWNGNLELC